MKIQILDLARNDLVEGRCFYDKQEAGLGDYFLSHLFEDIDQLRVTAGSHRKAYLDYHRALSRRFPFAIFYKVDGDVVQVWAVVDCRRKPSWIRRHLRGR